MLSNQRQAKPLSKIDATELAAAIKSGKIRGKIKMFNIDWRNFILCFSFCTRGILLFRGFLTLANKDISSQ